MQAANTFALDANSHVPLYVQLRDRLREMIAAGSLRTGERLAPTRDFARELGVHRATVEAAYAELGSEGLLVGHVGRGTFVAGVPQAPVHTPRQIPTSTFYWQGYFPGGGTQEDSLEALMRAASESGAISFAAAHPPVSALPVAQFRQACDRALQTHGSDLLRPAPTGGYPPLQELIAEQLGEHGIATPSEEITIINGCQQGLDLLAKAFVQPGQSVVVENPTYPGALLPFRQAGARIWPMPAGADGPDLTALEAILEGNGARLILVTPNFQNPTGATMSVESRRRLLETARRFQIPVAENDSYGQLGFGAKTLPSLKSMDRANGVIYLGSFSKAGFPGLRLGWCVAPPEATVRLRRAKQATDLHTDPFVQAVMTEFARGGALRRSIDAVRDICRKNAATLSKEVARHFPDEVVWRAPQGGMSAWFRMTPGVTADAVLARTRQHRVVFTPGRHFYFQDARPETFRLCFGNVSRTEISRGIKVLGDAIRAEMRMAATRRRTQGNQPKGAGWSLV